MSFPAVVRPLRRLWSISADLLRTPRAFIAAVFGFQRRTDYNRWSSNNSLQANWNERTLIAANYIKPGSSVVEFGAGAQALRAALPAGCRYQAFDLVARTPDTLVCDLNIGYPDLDGQADVAFFSGVLEYIQDLPSLFAWLSEQVDQVVFTYATFEHTPSLLERRRNGWINSLCEKQIVQVVEHAGFQGRAVAQWRGHVIFVVTRQWE